MQIVFGLLCTAEGCPVAVERAEAAVDVAAEQQTAAGRHERHGGGPLSSCFQTVAPVSQWAEAHETDRKETLAKAMAAAFGTNPPPASLKLAADARQRALRWAPPGFEPARASAAESGPSDIAPAAELPAWMNG